MNTAALDPRIGYLNSGVFYAFANGYDQPEVRGTREEVEIALGLRQPAPAAKAPAKRALKAKKYEVTVTPSVILYMEGGRLGAYTTEVWATSNSNAITMARREREANGDGGRYGVPATYRARRVD